MHVQDLGAPRVVVDAAGLTGAGSKQTALLSLLILNADRRVSTDQLIVAGWGYDSETSTAVIENHIWRLRRMLDPLRSPDSPALIVTEPGGSRLAIPRDGLDSVRFERFVAEAAKALESGGYAQALESCDRAIALWRGAPCMPGCSSCASMAVLPGTTAKAACRADSGARAARVAAATRCTTPSRAPSDLL